MENRATLVAGAECLGSMKSIPVPRSPDPAAARTSLAGHRVIHRGPWWSSFLLRAKNAVPAGVAVGIVSRQCAPNGSCNDSAGGGAMAYAAIPSTGASGARPRIMSDAFSAIIIVEL